MNIRFQHSPEETRRMDTKQLRDNYLISGIMQPGQIRSIYSHFDRMIIGGVVPGAEPIPLANEGELKADYFLERRELGIINVGGSGFVTTDDHRFDMEKLDCVYLGRGTRQVSFASTSEEKPACFYLLSLPAHHSYPNRKMSKAEAAPVHLGETGTSNQRIIYKYIHQDGIESCQLVMGLTLLKEGSVWNSVPPHTHTRRMEVYFYFDLQESHRVVHMMGEPQETRHLIVANHEAVISAPWSMHFGVGTSHYGFIWGMGGENKEFTDMDPVPIATIR